jgi:hypothetical protein
VILAILERSISLGVQRCSANPFTCAVGAGKRASPGS